MYTVPLFIYCWVESETEIICQNRMYEKFSWHVVLHSIYFIPKLRLCIGPAWDQLIFNSFNSKLRYNQRFYIAFILNYVSLGCKGKSSPPFFLILKKIHFLNWLKIKWIDPNPLMHLILHSDIKKSFNNRPTVLNSPNTKSFICGWLWCLLTLLLFFVLGSICR